MRPSVELKGVYATSVVRAEGIVTIYFLSIIPEENIWHCLTKRKTLEELLF